LVLAVVAGAFVFSDLVMMKYLAFGLLIALLLDATIIRMFLVPAIMKLLGDDCWWAPRWMKRLQERLGLGETELPDERKRPAVRDSREDAEALVGAGAPVAPRPRPRDPTHPAAEGGARSGATTRIATAPRANAPSVAGTTRIPNARPSADEPQTTRLSMAKNAVRNVVSNATAATQRTYRHAPPPPPPAQPPRDPQVPREEREIESWLGELRGTAPAGGKPAGGKPGGGKPAGGKPTSPPRPSADATRAMPEPRPRPLRPQPGNEPTTAIPTQRPRPQNADATTAIPTPRQQDPESTEKLNTREDDEPKRRGGGMSAQELLRREGRL
jgi:RND superfamily putative drug exporter